MEGRLHLVGFRGRGEGGEAQAQGLGRVARSSEAPAPISSCASLPGTGVGTGLLAALPVPTATANSRRFLTLWRREGGWSGGGAGVSPQTEAPQDGAHRVTSEGGMGRSSGDPSAAPGARGLPQGPGHRGP